MAQVTNRVCDVCGGLKLVKAVVATMATEDGHSQEASADLCHRHRARAWQFIQRGMIAAKPRQPQPQPELEEPPV